LTLGTQPKGSSVDRRLWRRRPWSREEGGPRRAALLQGTPAHPAKLTQIHPDVLEALERQRRPSPWGFGIHPLRIFGLELTRSSMDRNWACRIGPRAADRNGSSAMRDTYMRVISCSCCSVALPPGPPRRPGSPARQRYPACPHGFDAESHRPEVDHRSSGIEAELGITHSSAQPLMSALLARHLGEALSVSMQTPLWPALHVRCFGRRQPCRPSIYTP
jgi:hypothetical protein